MKATELRIGNYVYYNGTNGPTHNINKIDGTDINTMEFKKEYLALHSPIPLTEQWLKDFDIYKPQGVHTANFSGLISIKKDGVGWSLYIGNIHIKYIKYVHQLQNLYFALTDIELTT